MLLALIPGHCPSAPGAVNETTGLTEFMFNDGLARDISRALDLSPVTVELIYRDEPNDYSGLPFKVNQARPDAIIELHCNAFNRSASGTEMLYWHRSHRGMKLARLLQDEVVSALGLKDRGIKPIERGRGAHLLERTIAPCVIAESFFIDSDHDLSRAMQCRDDLVRAYANAIQTYAG